MVTAVAEKTEGTTSVLANMAKRFVDADAAVERAEEALKGLKKTRDIAESRLVDQMTTESVKSFKTVNFGGFRSAVEVYPNVVDREALNAYVKKTKKLAFLYTTNIHGTKLRSFVRELMEASKPIPPGIDPYMKTVIRRFK